MSERQLPSAFIGPMLAEAFPAQYRTEALSAGRATADVLAAQQPTRRFSVQVEGETVHIPNRLHFEPDLLVIPERYEGLRFACALQTRSGDGFERQQAARELLPDVQPWAAPFIIALIGEYIVEILDDIHAVLTPENVGVLAAFIIQNEAYWDTTKSRVTSYWNAYYRARWLTDERRAERRDEYVGFRLIQELDAAAAVARLRSSNG